MSEVRLSFETPPGSSRQPTTRSALPALRRTDTPREYLAFLGGKTHSRVLPLASIPPGLDPVHMKLRKTCSIARSCLQPPRSSDQSSAAPFRQDVETSSIPLACHAHARHCTSPHYRELEAAWNERDCKCKVSRWPSRRFQGCVGRHVWGVVSSDGRDQHRFSGVWALGTAKL